MKEVFLKKDRRKRLEAGHPWIYQNEIASVKGDPVTGDAVVIRNHQGHGLGAGFYHAESQIGVRIASYDSTETLNDAWLKRTLTKAWLHRKRFLAQTSSCRAAFGEADYLPGLIVDKYGDVAVIQVLSAAMELRKDAIVRAVRDVLSVTCVYERSDAPVRALEGLAESVGPLYGECEDVVEIKENGLSFIVDIAEGQKTGHFFDQRENRAALASLVRFAAAEKPRTDLRYHEGGAALAHAARSGATVLDCFSHTGGFSVHALHYGAAHVTTVDASEKAIEAAARNIKKNELEDRSTRLVANAFDLLREYERDKKTFDVVILDPPAFAKNRAAVPGALRGYKEINLRALKLIPDGGFLVTASCSSPITREAWHAVIEEAAVDAHKLLRLIDDRSAGADHPRRIGMPESDYLKFSVFQVQSRS
ncbi:class I SAM-dependent rRNA methyltransferase [Ferroacidibacillus organovorans]|uniref:PUA domain-containing protein n=1 Tax=Ferroacidibacillus organovorans TaxID=1765683 RepID=A0A853K6Q3_9BACL|nr:class I SAM-dependent rRNA methyltransferase [Ferroacidibacillus organovorans]KYP79523.1 hypothetical protein AYJ22_14560 [Ferroacidibacillus organovorans]OAG87251.1 hypothetical protein AYW79_14765 [Ferroacidibacillus organovorans]